MGRCINASLCVVTGSFAAAAWADPVLDNLDQPIRDITVFGTVAPDNIWAAQAFGVPSYYTLDSIDAVLGLATDPSDGFAELREGLDPTGPVIATFALGVLPAAGTEIVSLVPDTAVVLRPDRTYWVVMGTLTTGSFVWAYSEGNAWTGPGTIGEYQYSYDQGALWGVAGTDNPYQFRVNGTPLECPCPADFDGSGGTPDTTDIDAFFISWLEGDPLADTDCSGGTPDLTDISVFFDAWLAGGC